MRYLRIFLLIKISPTQTYLFEIQYTIYSILGIFDLDVVFSALKDLVHKIIALHKRPSIVSQ